MLKEYLVQLPDGTQLKCRPLTWGEYRRLTKQFENFEGSALWLLYDAVADLCLLDYEVPGSDVKYDDLYAGTTWVLGQVLLEETGFIPAEDKVAKHLAVARESVNKDYYHSAIAAVCAAFHKYSPEDIDEWTLDKLMYHLAIAEKVLGVQIDVAKEEDEQPKMTRLPNGQVVPLVTKRDLVRKKPRHFELDGKPERQKERTSRR